MRVGRLHQETRFRARSGPGAPRPRRSHLPQAKDRGHEWLEPSEGNWASKSATIRDDRRTIEHLRDKKDLIPVAKTGFCKSLIFQSLSLFEAGGICLLIMPLLALEDVQVRRINGIEGCNACVVNRNTNTQQLRDQIKACHYTLVLVSAEIILKKSFRKILHNRESA